MIISETASKGSLARTKRKNTGEWSKQGLENANDFDGWMTNPCDETATKQKCKTFRQFDFGTSTSTEPKLQTPRKSILVKHYTGLLKGCPSVLNTQLSKSTKSGSLNIK